MLLGLAIQVVGFFLVENNSCDIELPEVSQTIARYHLVFGGKSGLHRAGCQVTPGERELTASATENIPPACR